MFAPELRAALAHLGQARFAGLFRQMEQREVAEETGLTKLDYPFGDEFRETVPYAGNKVARYYLAETEEHDIELPVEGIAEAE